MKDLSKLEHAPRRQHELPRAQFAKPILVDDEAHEPGFPIGDDWAFEFYREVGGEG